MKEALEALKSSASLRALPHLGAPHAGADEEFALKAESAASRSDRRGRRGGPPGRVIASRPGFRDQRAHRRHLAGGLDALLSTVDAGGSRGHHGDRKAGAAAALMAARILALNDAALRKSCSNAEQMARDVEEKHRKLECL